jgi:type II secretory pathway component PulM
MTKLTSREKSLIVVLVLVAIFAVSFLVVIRPILDKRQEQKIEMAQLIQENKEAKALVDQIPELKASLEKKEEYIKTEETKFYQPMPSWEAERLVTNITKKHQVSVDNISIAAAVPYVPAAEGQAQNADQVTESVADIITVSVSYTTNLDGIKGMINEIATSDKKIAVNSWNYTVKDGQWIGNIIVELYVLR